MTRNLYDYNSKIVFHCQELKRKKVIDLEWADGSKAFIKVQDNGNKWKIKHFSQLTIFWSYL